MIIRDTQDEADILTRMQAAEYEKELRAELAGSRGARRAEIRANRRMTMNELKATALRPELQETVAKVRALRDLTKTTGFQTSRSIGALLGRLSPDDLSAVSLELQK